MSVDALLARLSDRKSGRDELDELVGLIKTDAGFAGRFAGQALRTGTPGGTWFDLALSHVDEDCFRELVGLALENLEGARGAGNAESVIAYASLQFPPLLHPHLERIWTLQPNQGTYYQDYPWRDSWPGSQPQLLRLLDDPVPAERYLAWQRLFECRTEQSLTLAVARASSVAPVHPLEIYLSEAGFASPARGLYRSGTRHLVLPLDVMPPRPSWQGYDMHPTWTLPGEGPTLRLGGTVDSDCGLCGGQLHHLLTLPPDAFPGTVEHQVALATCLSCQGWEAQPLYFSHADPLRPRALDEGQVTPQFPAGPFQEIRVRLAPTPPRWRWQDWGLSNSRENLFRVGGYPSWIQGAEYPACVSCHEKMHFILQLDSWLSTVGQPEYLWGSGGLCYGFWCPQCEISAFLGQWT